MILIVVAVVLLMTSFLGRVLPSCLVVWWWKFRSGLGVLKEDEHWLGMEAATLAR